MTAYAWQGSGAWEIPEFLRRALHDSGIGGSGFGHGWPGGPGGPGGPGRTRTRGSWSGSRPGGPWGWGQWDRQGPKAPRAGRGDVRSAVLALLAEEPMHGYQIIQEIGRRSGGAWKPSPGSVYPTLQQLEDEGLVRADEQEGRRVYRLTADGEQLATERAEEFASLWEGFAPSEDDTQIGDLVFQVGAAFVHVMRTGSVEQIAEARKVLARTRADLYRILGTDGDDGADDVEEE